MERYITFFGSDVIFADVWSGQRVCYAVPGETRPRCCLCQTLAPSLSTHLLKTWLFVWRAVRPGHPPLKTVDGRPTSEEYYCQVCYCRLYRNGLGKHLKCPKPNWVGQRHVSIRTKKLYLGFPYLQRFWGLRGQELDDFRRINQALFGGFSAPF